MFSERLSRYLFINLGPYDSVRTKHRTLTALYTCFGVPYRDIDRYIPFSYCAVAVGQVPSIGISDTFTVSPSPFIIFAIVFLTNSGAASETTGFSETFPLNFSGTFTSCILSRASLPP
jgi:hypothetical protein